MAIERDKSKPIFEDFIIAETGDYVLWFLVNGNPCGKHSYRLERVEDPTLATTYVLGFDVMNQRNVETAGWHRLAAQRPDLASWFKQICAEQFPLCESCNEQWRKRGCS